MFAIRVADQLLEELPCDPGLINGYIGGGNAALLDQLETVERDAHDGHARPRSPLSMGRSGSHGSSRRQVQNDLGGSRIVLGVQVQPSRAPAKMQAVSIDEARQIGANPLHLGEAEQRRHVDAHRERALALEHQEAIAPPECGGYRSTLLPLFIHPSSTPRASISVH